MSVSLSSEVTEDSQTRPNNQTVGWQIPADWIGVTGGISETSDGVLAWGRAPVEKINQNRRVWAESLELPVDSLVTLEQTHGARVIRVNSTHRDSGFLDPKTRIPDTDGLFTNDRKIALITSHSDCAPIFFFHPESSVVGLVHAGWRGTLAGIASAGASRIQEEFGVLPSELKVAIGPMITTCNYPVGDDIAKLFVDKFGPGVIARYNNRPHLDLFAAIVIDLLRVGVSQARVSVRPPDTFSNPRWSSYRRDGEQAGGMLAYIRLIM